MTQKAPVERQPDAFTLTRWLYFIAALVIVLWGIQAAKSVVIPFLLSVFISILCGPPLLWLKKRGLPKGIALLLLLGLLLGVLSVGIGLLNSSILEFADNFVTSVEEAGEKPEAGPKPADRAPPELPPAASNAQEIGADLVRTIDEAEKRALAMQDGDFSEVEEKLIEYLRGVTPAFALPTLKVAEKNVSKVATRAFQFVGGVFGQLIGLLTNAFLILLTVIFMLLEASGFREKLRASSGDSDRLLGRAEGFVGKVNRYIAIKTVLSLATGSLIAAWLWLLGVNHPLLWGLLAFLLNYIPNLGSLLASAPPILMAFVQSEGDTLLTPGLPLAFAAMLGCAVVNIVIGNLVEPKLLGRGLDLSPLVVFLSLVVWGALLGPVGMILSVPLTMTVKIALELDKETRGLAVWLGSERDAKVKTPSAIG